MKNNQNIVGRSLKAGLLILILVFQCISVVIAEEEYVLGSGDVVRVSVYGHQDLTTVARINEKGNITFPLISEIKIGESSVSQAEANIKQALKSGGYVMSPQVSLIVEQYRSQQVSVLGEVNKPGKYAIEGESTVIDLIVLAGGVTPSAAEVVHLIRRGEKEEQRIIVDLYNILQKGDLTKNIVVNNTDILFVPKMDKFYIYGEVQRPGMFRLERGMTVIQALAVGGGLTRRGTERGIQIKRHDSEGIIMETEDLLTHKLLPNDVIYVGESLF